MSLLNALLGDCLPIWDVRGSSISGSPSYGMERRQTHLARRAGLLTAAFFLAAGGKGSS